jgi:hypothetical protein
LKCEMIWKNGRKVNWKVERYGQYERKIRWIFERLVFPNDFTFQLNFLP